MNRKNPQTSIDAYRSLEHSKMLDMYNSIISALSVIGEGTFEDIAAHLKIDKSKVWKRLSEMERLQMIYKPGRKKLLKSNRSGYVWMLTNSTTPKTQEQENKFKKGQKTATDFANEIVSISQGALFNI